MKRQMLITKFRCSGCGYLLELSTDAPPVTQEGWAEGEPTGACRVENIITVVPCANCFKVVRDMKKAFDLINKPEVSSP